MSYAAIPLRLPEHRDALASLWAANMSDARIAAAIPARMRWLYEDAPEGPARTVLAVVEETGEVVGCGSVLPRRTWVEGRRVAGGVLCDFAVARAHRNAGAALTVQRALAAASRAAGLELVYGFPNGKSLAVFKRIGYRVVGQTCSWVKPLHSEYKLRRFVPARWMARACAAPVDLGLRAVDAVRLLRGPSLAAAVGEAPGAPVDALWERARGGHGVVSEKTSGYLDWRYRRFPTGAHELLSVGPREGGGLAGYAVYAIEDGKAFVRDLLAGPEDGAAEGVLLHLAAHLRRRGVDSIFLTLLGGPEVGARLRRVGFLPRGGERSLVILPDCVSEATGAVVFDPARWFMLEGELDI